MFFWYVFNVQTCFQDTDCKGSMVLVLCGLGPGGRQAYFAQNTSTSCLSRSGQSCSFLQPRQTLTSITRSGNPILGRYKYLRGFHVRKGSEFQGCRIPVEKAPSSTSQRSWGRWKRFLAWLTSSLWFSQTLFANLNHINPNSAGNTWPCVHLLLRILRPLKNYFWQSELETVPRASEEKHMPHENSH